MDLAQAGRAVWSYLWEGPPELPSQLRLEWRFVGIRWLGIAFLAAGGVTLYLGPAWATLMMGLTFGLGHIVLGAVLLAAERRAKRIRLHREVA